MQGQNSGALFWIQAEEHFKNEDNDNEDESEDSDEDYDHYGRNQELCGIFYYPYDNSLKKFESYKPGSKILEFNICQDKFDMEDKFILIDQAFDFHILETKDRKIVALKKS